MANKKVVSIDVVEPYVRKSTMTISSFMDRKARSTFQFSEKSHSNKLLNTAIVLSFGVNVCLLALKMWIIMDSFSMILLYCVMDSILDVIAGGFVILTRQTMKNSTEYLNESNDYARLEENDHYPAGRALLEPVCNIVYSTAMCSASLQLAFYSIKHLIESGSTHPQFTNEVFLVVGFTIVIKFVLYAVCKMLATRKGQHVDILADDHISDVVNHIIALGLLIFTARSPNMSWIDDLGCLLLSSTTAISWVLSDRKVFGILSGSAATPDFYAYIATILDENLPSDPVTGIQDFSVTKISAFHFGIKYMVEVELKPTPGLLRMSDGLRYLQEVGLKLERCIMENDAVGHTVERCVVTLSSDQGTSCPQTSPKLSNTKNSSSSRSKEVKNEHHLNKFHKSDHHHNQH